MIGKGNRTDRGVRRWLVERNREKKYIGRRKI